MTAATKQFMRQFETLRDKDAVERARYHTEQAELARLEAEETYRQGLAEKVEIAQESAHVSGKISKALLHFYGTKIDGEILAILRGGERDERGQIESLFEMAAAINRHKEPVPVLVDSPQTYGYIDGPSENVRELRLVLVNPRRPFFSDRKIKKAVAMHAFTNEKADVVDKSFGLLGVTHTARVFDDGNIGTERLCGTRGNRCELISTEQRADGRSLSGYSEYAFSGRHSDLVTSEEGDPEYTVGWEALDELVAQTYPRQTRLTAARNIVALAAGGNVNPELPVTCEVLGRRP